MAGSLAEPMPQTVEAYQRLAQRDLELIMEQRAEIGRLNAKINKLNQKLIASRRREAFSMDRGA